MPDIVADAIPELPPGVILTYVQTYLGLPWYIWGFVVAGFILFLVCLLAVYYYWKMGPVHGYWTATRNGQDLGVLIMKSGRMKFIAIRYLGKVFNAIGLPLSWIQRSPESHRFGEVNAKVLMDAWGITTDPKLQQAVKVIVEEWNQDHIDPKTREPYDQIQNYYDLMELIKEGKIDDPILIPAVFEVPLYEVERFLPKIGGADLEGHVAARVAEEMEEFKGNSIPGWMKIFMLFIVGIVVVIIAAFLLKG
jgi:hypothetical protein